MIWMIVFVISALIWVLPAVLVAFSADVQGSEKVLWMLGVLFTSWLGFVVFLISKRGKVVTSQDSC